MRLGAALHREAGGLVEDIDVLVLMQDHAVEQLALILGERLGLGRWRIGGPRLEGKRRHTDLLARFEPGIGFHSLAPDA